MRRPPTPFRLLTACALFLCGGVRGARLVVDGRPNATIVLGNDCSGAALAAATELQGFVKEIAGATLPVVKTNDPDLSGLLADGASVVLVGQSPAAEARYESGGALAPDGFHLRAEGDVILVRGRDAVYYDPLPYRTPVSAGTLYGVYKLAEIMGVRFYQQENPFVPKRGTIEVDDVALTDGPFFPYRIQEVMTDPWYRRIGYGADRDPWATRHSFSNWHDRFADTHPEYFRVNPDGQPDLHYPAFTQGGVHGNVIDQMIADAKAHFSNTSLPEGKRRYFGVLANDYFMSPCICAACRSWVDETRPKTGWYSDYIGQAVVQIANAVRDDFPDCYIVYGAYERYLLPPTRIEKLPDNVMVMIAGLRRATLPHWLDADEEELLESWQKLQPAAIGYWRYYTYGKRGVPWVMPSLIEESIKNMKRASGRHGVPVVGEMHFFMYHPTTHWWQNVNDYVSAKLLWNPDLSADVLLDEYYADFYGPARAEMKSFFGLLERNYMAHSDSSYIPEDRALRLHRLLGVSLAKVRGGEVESRIAYIRDNFPALAKFVAIYNEEVPPSSPEFRESHRRLLVNGATANFHNVADNGGEYVFDGISGHLRLKNAHYPGRAYTLEAWIRPEEMVFRPVIYGESFNTYEPYYIFGSKMVNPTYNQIGLAFVGPALLLNDQRFGKVRSRDLVLTPGKWMHVMAVVDADKGEMKLYLDGEIVGLETVLDDVAKTPSIQVVGAGGDNDSYSTLSGCRGFFKGAMKNAAVYDAALNPAHPPRKTVYRPPAAGTLVLDENYGSASGRDGTGSWGFEGARSLNGESFSVSMSNYGNTCFLPLTGRFQVGEEPSTIDIGLETWTTTTPPGSPAVNLYLFYPTWGAKQYAQFFAGNGGELKRTHAIDVPTNAASVIRLATSGRSGPEAYSGRSTNTMSFTTAGWGAGVNQIVLNAPGNGIVNVAWVKVYTGVAEKSPPLAVAQPTVAVFAIR